MAVTDKNTPSLGAEPAFDLSNTDIKRSSDLVDIGASYLTKTLPLLFPTKFSEGGIITVVPLTQGSVNMTFLVTGGVEPFVCRASPNHDFGGNQNQHESEWSQYHKEQYWQNTLRRDFPQLADKISAVEGISYIAPHDLLPELQRTGVSGAPSGLAVSIQTVANGSSPDHEQNLQVQEQLGQIASIINSVVPTGLGNRFDHNTEAFYTDRRWHTPSPMELVDWKIKNVGLDTLVENGTISSSEAESLSSLFQKFRDNADLSPCLVFGDMNIGCALVGGLGNVTGIVDFEGLRSGPGIYDQISERYLKETPATYQAFARGYAQGLGQTEEQFVATHQAHIVSAALLEFLPQFKTSLPNAQQRSLLQRLITDAS